jgi:hypothetical protein
VVYQVSREQHPSRPNMPKRICNKCDKKKPSYDFYDDSRNTCKECKKMYSKDRYQASKGDVKYVEERRNKVNDDQQLDDDLQYKNKKLKKRVRKLEERMDTMNHIIYQQKKEICQINALNDGFVTSFKVNQEEELDSANIVEILE